MELFHIDTPYRLVCEIFAWLSGSNLIMNRNPQEVKKCQREMIDLTDTKLLDLSSDPIRLTHYSIRTEEAYANWIKCYTQVHNVRHPVEMGARG